MNTGGSYKTPDTGRKIEEMFSWLQYIKVRGEAHITKTMVKLFLIGKAIMGKQKTHGGRCN